VANGMPITSIPAHEVAAVLRRLAAHAESRVLIARPGWRTGGTSLRIWSWIIYAGSGRASIPGTWTWSLLA